MQVPDINGTICFSCCSSMHWKLQISSIHLMDLLHIAHAIQTMSSSAHCLKIWIILPVMIYGRAWTKVVLLILTCWRWHLVWNARHPCYKMQHQYVTLPTLSCVYNYLSWFQYITSQIFVYFISGKWSGQKLLQKFRLPRKNYINLYSAAP